MGKGALRPFFKGHSLKKEKEHEKKEVDKMLLHFVTLPSFIIEMISETDKQDLAERIAAKRKTEAECDA